MRLIGLILLSVLAFGLTLFLMDRVLDIQSDQFYWLCFAASGIVLAAGLFIGFRSSKTASWIAIISILATTFLVILGDIVLAVVYSCAKGVCL
jgi:ABC-type Fe3+ transport system permease subunit